MILKGRSRGHASQLARYLFHEKNDSITVLDLRGTCAHDLNRNGLIDAMKEFDEYGKLTQGEKTVFHLAIAPADYDRMDAGKWQYAVAKAEEALGFVGQPRAVVMHEYEGKEHLHVAWSRVDLETHKLKSDSFTNLKLCNAARDIELELGLSRLPDIHRGHEKARQLQEDLSRDPNENREIDNSLSRLPDIHRGHEQAKQLQEELRREDLRNERKESQRQQEIRRFTEEQGSHTKDELKRKIASSWHQAESGLEFQAELEKRGLRLALGDRGAVVLDEQANVYSPARYIQGVKLKDINKKCADVLEHLQTVDQARDHGREIMLTPRKATKLTRTKLRLEIANDLMQPRRLTEENEEYEP